MRPKLVYWLDFDLWTALEKGLMIATLFQITGYT